MTQPVDNRLILERLQKSTKEIINRQNQQQSTVSKSFEDVLANVKTKEVTFSKHATQRLNDRQVKLTDHEIERVSEAMDRASKKGIKDAVILLEGKVLIANIPSKTIITASKSSDLEEQIITNINGAILI
jgi:flagellar operon protein